jgi:hypothetical protein
MLKTNNLKKGSILSETSFYVVKEIQTKAVVVIDDMGNELTIGNPYVEKILQSADCFSTTEPKNMSELADIFVNSPRVAMTVCFITKETPKAKKVYEEEIRVAADQVRNAKIGDVDKLLAKLLSNPISKNVPGSERVMRGRHYGTKDDFGRIHFIDMEITKDRALAYDNRSRQVDPRTIQYIIVGNTKYTLK